MIQKQRQFLKIGGLEVEVLSQEEIARSGAPILAVPYDMALHPIDERYITGTRNGFPCVLCNCDCILAPSGQTQRAMGNPVICFRCMESMARGKGKAS